MGGAAGHFFYLTKPLDELKLYESGAHVGRAHVGRAQSARRDLLSELNLFTN